MARVKYFNPNTGKWEYADSCFAVGGNDSGGNPDWNQNDPTAPDYVKNRPFCITYEEKTIELNDGGLLRLEGFPNFAVGDTVTIKVDGVKHSLVAYEMMGVPVIGDNPQDLFAGNAKLGWFLGVDGDMAIFQAPEGHTVSYNSEVIHQINKKYIPNYNAMVLLLNNLIDGYQLATELSNGATVYSVSPDIDFKALPDLSMCDLGNLGFAQKDSRGQYFVLFSYTRILAGTMSEFVLVHSDRIEQGIAEYKEAYGVE